MSRRRARNCPEECGRDPCWGYARFSSARPSSSSSHRQHLAHVSAFFGSTRLYPHTQVYSRRWGGAETPNIQPRPLHPTFARTLARCCVLARAIEKRRDGSSDSLVLGPGRPAAAGCGNAATSVRRRWYDVTKGLLLLHEGFTFTVRLLYHDVTTATTTTTTAATATTTTTRLRCYAYGTTLLPRLRYCRATATVRRRCDDVTATLRPLHYYLTTMLLLRYDFTTTGPYSGTLGRTWADSGVLGCSRGHFTTTS